MHSTTVYTFLSDANLWSLYRATSLRKRHVVGHGTRVAGPFTAMHMFERLLRDHNSRLSLHPTAARSAALTPGFCQILVRVTMSVPSHAAPLRPAAVLGSGGRVAQPVEGVLR